jgi:UPF0755 protein
MPKGKGSRPVALLALALIIAFLFTIATSPRSSDKNMVNLIVKRGTKIGGVASLLKNKDLIGSRYIFMACALLLHKGRIVAGEYELSKNMSPVGIAGKMAKGERKVYTLCIVEGHNLYSVGENIQRVGIMEDRAFLDLARNSQFLRRLDVPSDSLEGYLFPDTYFFSKETSVDEFIETIVRRTFKFFEREDLKLQMQNIHMNMFEVLSLASIIEKEAKLEMEKPLISAVFHNRLRVGMTLDADPTVIYGQSSFDRSLTKSDLMTMTPYNTYRQKGLPKGPICNPSKSSIIAALNPDKSDVLYFVSRNDGSHVFSRTISEHNRYVNIYQKSKNRPGSSEETKKRTTGKYESPELWLPRTRALS